MELTDVQIRALAEGDPKTFLLLYENYFVALCVFARNYSIEKEEAEDIVQDVFCKLYDDRLFFENLISLKSYLYTSIRNGCLNYLRNRKRRRDREACYYDDIDDERNFLDEIMESELYRQLKMLLEELPPQCRNIFERVLQGETSEEIATTMDLSVETVKTQRKKAKRILRERFTSLYDIFGYLL